MWGDQHQLIEKERRDHGKTPSNKSRNEDILSGFQAPGMSHRLEVHNHQLSEWLLVSMVPIQTEKREVFPKGVPFFQI
jgi:hypothetical protein